MHGDALIDEQIEGKRRGLMSWENNLKNRKGQQWADALRPFQAQKQILLQSPCDLGVIRNGGKRGAKHAPQALLAPLKKMVGQAEEIGSFSFSPENYLGSSQEKENLEAFPTLQEKEAKAFFEVFQKAKNLQRVAHIGGGHDHIYPLVRSYLEAFPNEEILILNIDAHLDTRIDKEVHSGTPFRQLSQEFGKRLQLLQLGIHSFANGKENFEGIEDMLVIPWQSEGEFTYVKELDKVLSLNRDKTLVLSLDCDGLDASYMGAVSAPNHRGLSQKEFHAIFHECQKFWQQSQKPALYGLYEFNPLFDDLTTKSARFLAASLFDFFE